MLKVTLFRGTEKNHKRLIEENHQNPPRERKLILMAVIHEENIDAGVRDAKVLLYQEVLDLDHYWIRKENTRGDLGRTNYAETNCLDALTALGGFETSVQVMLDRLTDRLAGVVTRQHSNPA